MEILTFLLGNEKFAIDVKLVDTIEYKMPVTIVPKAKKCVLGLINIRGNVLPFIDTNLILKTQNVSNDLNKIIIVKVKNEKIALAATDIDDVLEIADENIQKISSGRNMHVVNFDNNVITLLNFDDLKKIYS